MMQFITWFINGFEDIGNLLNNYTFPIGALNVSILDILIGFIALALVIAVFWKGAHT